MKPYSNDSGRDVVFVDYSSSVVGTSVLDSSAAPATLAGLTQRVQVEMAFSYPLKRFPQQGNLEIRESDQEWFWTPEWQAAEREVDADLAAGRFETFDNMEDFLSDLE